MKNAKSRGLPGRGGGGLAHAPRHPPDRSGREEILNKKRELRRQVTERLERNLRSLESHCRAEGAGCWPPRSLLKEIQDDVIVLAGLERVARFWPIWEAFEHVSKRNKKLQLEAGVNRLIDRALAMLRSESDLGKAVWEAMRGNAKAQSWLRDTVLKAGNPAELFWEYRQVVREQCLASPLVCWLAEIRHPMAKDFGIKIFATVEEVKAEDRREHKRDTTRKRQRRWRLRQKR